MNKLTASQFAAQVSDTGFVGIVGEGMQTRFLCGAFTIVGHGLNRKLMAPILLSMTTPGVDACRLASSPPESTCFGLRWL